MMKPSLFNALVIRINLVIVAFVVLACVIRVHRLPSSHEEKIDISLQCIHDDCLQKVVRLEDFGEDEGPNFLNELNKDTRFGLVNMELNEEFDSRSIGRATTISFDRVSEELKWDDLFPEWIDEERTPTCPEIPMPEFSMYEEVDVVAARFPCRRPEKGWKRDVRRLQVHLVAAEVAVRKAARDEKGRVRMVFVDECRPMMEVFKSEELVRREGDWWMYRVNVERLEQKLALPVGSCMLALPSSQQGTGETHKKNSNLAAPGNHHRRREAYATVLHSSDIYLCGAITLGQSLLKTGTDRDLLLLHDDSIPSLALRALSAAGWRLLPITRIRNPHATKNSYNEYNYSKLRLWQLTDYHKLVFVDADILVLRNLDHLFRLPELAAAGNDRDVFNSGVMVIEPSNHTFDLLMELAGEVVPYNGGDQGLLNEAYVWWHRLPRRVNFLKNVWSNKTEEAAAKDGLYAAEPAELYAIHYLGLKPWLCFRDYDCNWNVEDQRVYASDAAHWRWWKVHDEMEMGLRRWCGLTRRREELLRKELSRAKEAGFRDGHWRLRISDRRRRVLHK